MTETITSEEFIAEMLPQEVIEDLDEAVIYISDDTDGSSDEEAEDDCPQEEEEYRTAKFARVSLILRSFRSIFQALLKRGLLFFKRIVRLL